MSAVLTSALQPRAPAWRQSMPAMLLAMAAVLLIYRDSFAAMVAIWARSDTFAHAFLVPPISLWLIWRQREQLAPMSPRPQPWMLLPLALTALAWLLGELAGVNALTQGAATAMLILVVPALLGLPVARALSFPLAFLFFMVPLGEFLMPTLMTWTADVTVFVLRLFGLPVYREGLQFVIPSGTWSVIEACSGIRYLIASFMVGTLFAYMNFNSTKRRLLFGIVSLLVPVVANWIRAVLIVMIGHLSDNRLAVGVDHLIYGWVFFGVVVMLMFFIGARWAEPPLPPGAMAATPVAAAGSASSASSAKWLPWLALSLVVVVLWLPRVAAWRIDSQVLATPTLVMPVLAGSALAVDASPLHKPIFEGPHAEASAVYGSGAGAVTVHVAYYRHQTYGHKLVNSQNMLVTSEDPTWHLSGSRQQALALPAGGSLVVRAAELREGALSGSQRGRRIHVRQIYWVDGQFTSSDTAAALRALVAGLSGRGDDGAAITFYQLADDDERESGPLDVFVARQLDTLGPWLSSVRDKR